MKAAFLAAAVAAAWGSDLPVPAPSEYGNSGVPAGEGYVALADPASPVSPDTNVQAILDTAFGALDRDAAPGCVGAVLRGGRLVARAATGLASLEHEVPLNSATPLHVGSIAKQFIAAVALILDSRGRLDLDAPVNALVAELPDRFRSVTGRHLLTHTSGLRDYLQAAHHAGAGLNESPSREDALVFLARQRRLDFPPGTEASYSNSNYLLLTLMIERVEEATIDEIARRLLFEPLGMRSSRFLTDGLEVVPGRARGYREVEAGRYRLHEPAPGVGGLLTTLDDLLLWAGHLRRMRADEDPLLVKLTTPATLADGRTTREAAGLNVDLRFGRKVVEHSGSNRGFNAYLGWYAEQDVFVTVMCNVRQARAPALGRDIAAALFDEPAPSRPAYPEMDEATLGRLAPYAGVYDALAGPGALELEVDPPHAIVTLYGDDPSDSRTASHVLAPTEEPDRFTLFGLSPAGRVLLGSGSAARTVAVQLEGAADRRYAKVAVPGRKDLESLAGRYRSDELNVVYVLSVGDGVPGLVIERPDGRTVDRGRLTPITRDFYVMENDPVSNIRVKRNARGRVVGFELSEPRLRGVVFVRAPGPSRGQIYFLRSDVQGREEKRGDWISPQSRLSERKQENRSVPCSADAQGGAEK